MSRISILCAGGPRPHRCGRIAGIATILLALAATTARSDTNQVWDYAERCYTRMGLKAEDLKGPFDCRKGEKLQVKEAGVVKDIGSPMAAATFPTSCDTPAWLWLSPQQCYGHSTIQILPTPSNANVKAALLCRHKKKWTDDPKKYDDIAMIVHNSSNGETCWFQTDDDTADLDGTVVKGPATVRDHSFWWTPEKTAGVKCVTCHDSGPWMNSRWMDNAINAKKPYMKDGQGAYVNNGIHFKDWDDPKFVAISRGKLGRRKRTCFGCHKIAAANSDGRGTCDEWIAYTIGRKNPTEIGKDNYANATGKGFDIAYWMPLRHREANPAAWKASYDKYIDRLLACCKAGGTGITGCEKHTPIKGRAALPLPSVRILASLDGGQTYPYMDEEPWREEPTSISVQPGTDLTLRWGAPAELEYCMLSVSFPLDMEVNGIRSGSTLGLDDGHPSKWIGELHEPGEYWFELNCDEDGEPRNARMVVEVEGERTPYLTLQAIVDGTASEAAVDPQGPSSVSVTAHRDSSSYLSWTAENVEEGSCTLTEISDSAPPPPVRHADHGFEQIHGLAAGELRTFTLDCLDTLGTPLGVELVLSVPEETTVVEFQAVRYASSTVQLDWSTLSEGPECSHFEVLRCDGSVPSCALEDYDTSVATVPCTLDPLGSSYSIDDPNVQIELAYSYLLRQFDTSGESVDHGPVDALMFDASFSRRRGIAALPKGNDRRSFEPRTWRKTQKQGGRRK